MNRTAQKPPQAELWRCDVGSATVAVLDIPGALDRRRTFDIDVTLVVRVPAEMAEPSHGLRVELDGKLQWQRQMEERRVGKECR